MYSERYNAQGFLSPITSSAAAVLLLVLKYCKSQACIN